MFKSRPTKIFITLASFMVLGLLVYQIPAVKTRLSWRLDIAQTYLRGVIQPAKAVPTPDAMFVPPTSETEPSLTPEPSPTTSPIPEELNTPTPTEIPTITLILHSRECDAASSRLGAAGLE